MTIFIFYKLHILHNFTTPHALGRESTYQRVGRLSTQTHLRQWLYAIKVATIMRNVECKRGGKGIPVGLGRKNELLNGDVRMQHQKIIGTRKSL